MLPIYDVAVIPSQVAFSFKRRFLTIAGPDRGTFERQTTAAFLRVVTLLDRDVLHPQRWLLVYPRIHHNHLPVKVPSHETVILRQVSVK